MLILFNATVSFYAHNSFFFLLRQPLFTHTILFSFYCDSLYLRTHFYFLFIATASFYEHCSFFFPAQRTVSSQIFSVLTLRKSARPSFACFSASAKSPIFAPTQV